LGKPYGIELRCYHLEHRGEYIWEQVGNKRKKQKILLPRPLLKRKKQKILLPHPLLKKKKNCTVHECMLSLLIGCMKFLFPKPFITIFHPNNLSTLLLELPFYFLTYLHIYICTHLPAYHYAHLSTFFT